MSYNIRSIVAIALACTIACTSTKSVSLSDLRREDLDGTYRFYLYDGRMLMSDRVASADSEFVITGLLTDGKRESIQPLVVRAEDIKSIQSFHYARVFS